MSVPVSNPGPCWSILLISIYWMLFCICLIQLGKFTSLCNKSVVIYLIKADISLLCAILHQLWQRNHRDKYGTIISIYTYLSIFSHLILAYALGLGSPCIAKSCCCFVVFILHFEADNTGPWNIIDDFKQNQFKSNVSSIL